MVRERLRQPQRTWWEHILSSGTEMATLVLSIVLVSAFTLAAYRHDTYHYLEEIGNPLLPVICVYIAVGAGLWIYGWIKEKASNASLGLKFDIAGSLLLATGWGAILAGAISTGNGDWMARSVTITLIVVWLLRALAGQRIQSRAEKVQQVFDDTILLKTEEKHGLGE